MPPIIFVSPVSYKQLRRALPTLADSAFHEGYEYGEARQGKDLNKDIHEVKLKARISQ